MSGATTTGFFSLSNIWKEVGATISGLGLLCAALAPIFAGNPPTNAAGGVATAGAILMGVVKVIGK